MRGIILLSVFLLAACGAMPVTMVNPDTGKTHLCSSSALDPIIASREVQQCVGILEATGWRSR